MKIRLSPKQISYLASLVLGLICFILGLTKILPGYYYFIFLGAAVIFFAYGIYGIFVMKKFFANPINMYTATQPKVKKLNPNKVQKCQKIQDDNTKVLATCPGCKRTIRLPNSKGKHGVTCPICKQYFEVKI